MNFQIFLRNAETGLERAFDNVQDVANFLACEAKHLWQGWEPLGELPAATVEAPVVAIDPLPVIEPSLIPAPDAPVDAPADVPADVPAAAPVEVPAAPVVDVPADGPVAPPAEGPAAPAEVSAAPVEAAPEVITVITPAAEPVVETPAAAPVEVAPEVPAAPAEVPAAAPSDTYLPASAVDQHSGDIVS